MEKYKLPLWALGGLMYVLSSCLGGDDVELDEWALSNAQIASFSLSCDSIEALSSVKFTIDQVNGLIYNKDSMAYGTNIDFKVVCSITYVIGYISGIEVHQLATDSKAYWNGTDSLDFTNDVIFYVYSYDGKKSKTYTAKLNVHQQHPDSMSWSLDSGRIPVFMPEYRKVVAFDGKYLMYAKQISGCELYESPTSGAFNWTKATLTGFENRSITLEQMTQYGDALYVSDSEGNLYRSEDGRSWTQDATAPKITALLGVVTECALQSAPDRFAALINDGGVKKFAFTDGSGVWQTGETVPSNFPLTGFASHSYSEMSYSHLTLVAGTGADGAVSSKSWDTMDGLKWVCISTGLKPYFSEREGIMLTVYDDKLYLIGGIDASNQGLKDMYTSTDHGVTWAVADSLTFLPEAFTGRGYSSAVVNEDKFLLLFGGKENRLTYMNDELWRGRINRLGFKD
ncbi:MAG: DUF6242 domain-containing protein [Tannerella sp.]|jgi:hypothetical protein|nr:DUF6242 domain-containing protein [Tannerella sp.]